MNEQPFENCDCRMPKPPKDTVKNVLINIHLKDTKPEILPRVHNPAYDKVMPLSKIRNVMYSEVRSLLTRPNQSRYGITATKTRPHAQIGRPRNGGTKPDDVNNFTRTFGCVVPVGPKLYEIILPPDVPKEVQDEWRTCDIARKRVYKYNDKFHPDYAFGQYNGANESGICTERCMNWIYHPANICVISKVQGEFLERTTAPDGEGLEPLKNRLQLPEDHAYNPAKPSSGESVADQLRECPPCPWKAKLMRGIARINRMRLTLKHREDFSLADVLKAFKLMDKDHLGVLPSDAAFLLLRKLRIALSLADIEELLRFMDILTEENNIRYEELLYAINHHEPYPRIKKIQDTPKQHRHYKTTYGDLLLDLEKAFERNELRVERLPDCDKTHMINPSACERNGLWQRDYAKGRSREDVRGLFAASGFELSDPDFETCWTECVRIDKQRLDGLVCVDTFLDYVDNKFTGNKM